MKKYFLNRCRGSILSRTIVQSILPNNGTKATVHATFVLKYQLFNFAKPTYELKLYKLKHSFLIVQNTDKTSKLPQTPVLTHIYEPYKVDTIKAKIGAESPSNTTSSFNHARRPQSKTNEKNINDATFTSLIFTAVNLR
ncbi:hypothetical protein [Vibrio rotiferianus]|uniref:hypothetical protein n=1 Tax=Vibrio rotiferianus TaxID=190895 RepID=UPI00391BA0C9